MKVITALIGMVGIVLCCPSAMATDALLHIDVSPEIPSASTPVSVDVWAWFQDSGQRFLAASCIRDGYELDIDVTMQDLHGSDTILRPVLTADGGSVDFGQLAPGLYNVCADMWLVPWGTETPELLHSGSATFTVVPEPSTAVLFGAAVLGSLAFARRRGK